MKFFDATAKLLIERGMGVIDQVGDIDEAIFRFEAAPTLHCGYFYAVKNEVRPFIVLNILMPSAITLNFFFKLFVLLDFEMNRSIEPAFLSFEERRDGRLFLFIAFDC